MNHPLSPAKLLVLLCLMITAMLLLVGGVVLMGPDYPDSTEQTEALERQIAQLRGRAWRAEQETADAMMEAARLRDMLAWDAAYYWRIEVGSPEWAAAKRALGEVDNSLLAVE